VNTFENALKYAKAIVQGKSKIDAYCIAHTCDKTLSTSQIYHLAYAYHTQNEQVKKAFEQLRTSSQQGSCQTYGLDAYGVC
jgi:hypothetical protein